MVSRRTGREEDTGFLEENAIDMLMYTSKLRGTDLAETSGNALPKLLSKGSVLSNSCLQC